MSTPTETNGMWRYLVQRRFGPFYWTIFLGSVNDNLLKFAITLILTYQVQVSGLPPALVGAATGALFVLPSLLFSTLAGIWTDAGAMDTLIRRGKIFEVGMMVLVAWALNALNGPVLLICVLLSGLHVTWFSTLKYAYVPRHLAQHELLSGNALMEAGLFTAILLGTVIGGWLVSPVPVTDGWSVQRTLLPLLLVGLALLGWWLSRHVPPSPELPVSASTEGAQALSALDAPHAVKDIWRHVYLAMKMPRIWWPMLGISWMWFFGAVWLGLFPVITRDILQALPSVASGLMVLTSVGIATGSLACHVLAKRGLGDWLMPLGMGGMLVFGADLGWSLWLLEGRAPLVPLHAGGMDYLQHGAYLRPTIALIGMAASMGLFSVPLYARVQAHAPALLRARLVAANNVINALLMVLSAVWMWWLVSMGATVAQVALCTMALHGVLCMLVFFRRPAAAAVQ
jgi:Major Facilitator Superfamily